MATEEQEVPLHAIVLCDRPPTFSSLAPAPFLDEDDATPWCLLPLLNRPLLAWTLEALELGNVQELTLFIHSSHSQALRAFLTESGLLQRAFPKITLRPTLEGTAGGILREVDSLSLLGSQNAATFNFLVAQVGYVGNLDLKAATEAFAERRKKDPSLCLSCVLTPPPATTTARRTKRRKHARDGDVSTFIVSPDPSSRRLFHLDHPSLSNSSGTTVALPREALSEAFKTPGAGAQVWLSPSPAHVFLCNLETPQLFTENFDYQTFLPDFVNGVLTSDLLGKTICATVVGDPAAAGAPVKKGQWAGCVSDWDTYFSVSQALIQRQVYPLTPTDALPDASYLPLVFASAFGPPQTSDVFDESEHPQLVQDDDEYTLSPFWSGVYQSRTSSVDPDADAAYSLVGAGSNVGQGCLLSHAVVGPSTSVAASSSIERSVVFPNVQIGADVTVERSILGQGVVLEDGVRVRGCVVGERVKLAKGSSVKGCWIEATPQDTGSSTNSAAGDKGVVFGAGSVAFLWEVQEGEEDSDDEDAASGRGGQGAGEGRSLGIKSLEVDTEELYDDGYDSESSASDLSRASSTASLSTLASHTTTTSVEPAIAGLANLDIEDDDAEDAGAGTGKSARDFERECVGSLERSFSEGHTVENASIELKTLRMASNVPLPRVRAVIVRFLLDKGQVVPGGTSGVWAKWAALVGIMTGEDADGQAEIILVAQTHLANLPSLPAVEATKAFLQTLKAWYEEDVIEEGSVVAWFKDPKAREGKLKPLWEQGKRFVEAIMEEDDEEEDEDSDEDD